MSAAAPPTSSYVESGPSEQWVLPEPRTVIRKPGWRERLRGARRWAGLYPAGWTLLALAVGCGLAGWWLRWIELRMAGLLGGLLVLVAWLFTLGRPRFGVHLGLARPRVVVGEAAQAELQVRHLAGRRTLPSRLDLPIGEDVASFTIPSLQVDQLWTHEFQVPTHRRGVVVLGPARSVQGDPFSLAGREYRWTEPLELFVHPQTVSLPGRLTGFVHDLEGQTSDHLTSSDMSFHALREYAPGDDRRHVHWRSTARTGRLMVRQFDETRQSRVCLALDTCEGSYLTESEFELAVSAIGSAALQCFREENPMVLMTTPTELPAVSAMRSLDELTRLKLVSQGGIHPLTRATRDRQPSASVVILATGSVPGPRQVRRACQIFDLDTRVLAIVAETDQPLAVSTMSNVTVIRIDQLDDLPRAIRQATA